MRVSVIPSYNGAKLERPCLSGVQEKPIVEVFAESGDGDSGGESADSKFTPTFHFLLCLPQSTAKNETLE